MAAVTTRAMTSVNVALMASPTFSLTGPTSTVSPLTGSLTSEPSRTKNGVTKLAMTVWKKSLIAPPIKIPTANVRRRDLLLIGLVCISQRKMVYLPLDFFASYCRTCFDDGRPLLSLALSAFFLRPDEGSSICVYVCSGIHLSLTQSVFKMEQAPDTVCRTSPAIMNIAVPSTEGHDNILRGALTQSHSFSYYS